MNLKQINLLWLGALGALLLILLTALYYQYAMHAEPCVLCVYIRACFVGLISLGLIGLALKQRTVLRLGVNILQILLAAWGLQIAAELFELQTNPSPFATCSFIAEFWLPLDQWLPWLFLPTGSCTDDIVQLFGLSMAQWCMLIFIGYALFAAAMSFVTYRQTKKIEA